MSESPDSRLGFFSLSSNSIDECDIGVRARLDTGCCVDIAWMLV